MNVDVTNHLVPSTLVNKLLNEAKRKAWAAGYEAGDSDRQQFESWEYITGYGEEPPNLTPNPHNNTA